MRIHTRLTGVSPLVMNNPRSVNQDDELVKAKTEISSKRTKTEDDRHAIYRLDFALGLYIDHDGPFVPVANVQRCFVEAAKVRRLGSTVERALYQVDFKAYVQYDGPRTVDGLYGVPAHQYLTSVGIGTKRIMKMRPMFPKWAIDVQWELTTDVLSAEDFTAIAQGAGIMTGLGDNRRNGYGRFGVEIS